MENHYIITISGLPATGTTTVAEYIQKQYGFQLISGGDIFRSVAEEKGMTQMELTEEASENSTIDRQVDKKLKQKIEHYAGKETVIFDSRLAGWHARNVQSFKIYLTASDEKRKQRIECSDRYETFSEMKRREQSEIQRYKDNYDVDITDPKHYDLVLDTGTLSKEEMLQKIMDELPEQLTTQTT